MARRSCSWQLQAERVIAAVHEALPADATWGERRAALRAACPFGARRRWPYRVWLGCRRAYLARHDDRPLTPEIAPLFFAAGDGQEGEPDGP